MNQSADLPPPSTSSLSSSLPEDPFLNAALLETFLTKSPIGFAFLDRDLKYRQINEVLAQINGVSAQEHIGKTIPEVCPVYSPDLLAGMRRVLETRQAIENVEVQAELPQAPGKMRVWLTSYYPVYARETDSEASSVVLGLGAFVTEITAQRQAENALQASREQQRVFLRDILFNLSEGKLRLCDSRTDLPAPLPLVGEPVELTLPTLRNLRKHMIHVAEETGLPEDRWQDLETAVGEAAMNAVIHGGGGVARVCARKSEGESGVMQIWVEDNGEGIALDRLHRATLERGFTTAGSMGHGWPMVLKTSDRVYLLTNSSGTTVVIEQEETPPEPAWLMGF